MEPIAFHLQYTPAELRAATRFHLSGTVRRTIEVVGGVLLIAMGAAFLTFYGYSLSFVALLALAPLLVFSLAWLSWITWLTYRKEPLFRDPFDLAFTEDGILYTSLKVNSRMEWPIFKKWRENDRMFLLHYGANMFVTIPKRVFQDPSQIDRFRELIDARIPDS